MPISTVVQERITRAQMLELRRWNTPTVYNGWEQITARDPGKDGFNLEEAVDYMPHMGPMTGFAVTVTCQPGNPEHRRRNAEAWADYRSYLGGIPGPKIVVVQDLDKPDVFGSFWGEVNANVHRALGCVGTIVDGAIRDLDEMSYAGFKALARRLCVGHAHSWPVEWGVPVEVFGRRVDPGNLIHADKHGFLVIPPEDEHLLLEATRFMDSAECRTVIPAARDHAGLSPGDILEQMRNAGREFGVLTQQRFGRRNEFHQGESFDSNKTPGV